MLWAGIEAGTDLAALAAAVETSLDALGIPREERAFSPHLTLARFDTPRGLDALHAAIEKAGPLEFGATTAQGISSLSKRSETRRGGIYSAGNIFVRGEKIRVNLEMAAGAPSLWGLVVLGYLLGSIPFGYLLVRATGGGDIRFIGSGNIGATNVARTSGWSVGVATLVLDTAKGFLAVWLTQHFSGGNIRFMMYAGLAAILGHIFPVWLRFDRRQRRGHRAGRFPGHLLAGPRSGRLAFPSRGPVLEIRVPRFDFRRGCFAAPRLSALRARPCAADSGLGQHAAGGGFGHRKTS